MFLAEGDERRILRLNRHRSAVAVPVDDEIKRLAGAGGDQQFDLAVALDRTAVDRLDEVAGDETGKGRPAAGLDRVDPRRDQLLAVDQRQCREDHNRENHVGDRTRRDDRSTRRDTLRGEGVRPFLGLEIGQRFAVGDAGFVLVTEEADEPAERNDREPPARTLAVGEAEDLLAEADRKKPSP